MDDDMWNLFNEIKNEEDKQLKISEGIDISNEDEIKCNCGCSEFIIEDNMHICIVLRSTFDEG
jgi:hypothetical protein